MKSLSTKATSIKPSGIRKFFDLASTMEGVISLGVGEPDFATPWHICENAIHYISTGHTHYTAHRGLLELREEICKFHKEHYNQTYDGQPRRHQGRQRTARRQAQYWRHAQKK